MREHLLNTASPDLPKAVEICTTAEATKEQMMTMKELSGDTNVRHELTKMTDEADIHQARVLSRKIPREEKRKEPLVKECWNCGQTHLIRKCPAFGV